MAELSRASGIPVATIKYYLRERLLPDGERTSATQARYDDSHVTRLRLIRALLGPGGLSIAKAREVLGVLDDPPASVYELLGVATAAVTPPITASAGEHDHVHQLLRRWGWRVDEKDCATHAALAEALRALEAGGFPTSEEEVDSYRAHVEPIARQEIEGIPDVSTDELVRYVILGTLLMEPLILALRRMAQQEWSARRYLPDPAD